MYFPASITSPFVACVVLSGCASSAPRQRFDVAPSPTSQPASELDVQQLSGQIVAGVKTELASRIEAAVDAQVHATGVGRDVTGYSSEFGIGATLVVTLTLILALILSHRREVMRIRRNGKSSSCEASRSVADHG